MTKKLIRKQTSRTGLRVVFAAFFTLMSSQVRLVAAAIPLAIHSRTAIAQTQSTKAVARVARAITVRVEGATQGSGALLRRDGNLYTVITAWHVVSGHQEGDELAIYTDDGDHYSVKKKDIRNIPGTDLATLTFESGKILTTANNREAKPPQAGSSVFISGHPVSSAAISQRQWRLSTGMISGRNESIDSQGYKLQYSSSTLPGMSGGPIFNERADLLGIHGRAETSSNESTEVAGIFVKTGTSLGIPIDLYVNDIFSKKENYRDLAWLANRWDGHKNRTRDLVEITSIALAMPRLTDKDRFRLLIYRANAFKLQGDLRESLAVYDQAIDISPSNIAARKLRGLARFEINNNRGAIDDLSVAISSKPTAEILYFRGLAYYFNEEYTKAYDDFKYSIKIDPRYGNAYGGRAIAAQRLGFWVSVCEDLQTAVELGAADVYKKQLMGCQDLNGTKDGIPY